MGSGIGLALSRSLAELHKGKLCIKKAKTTEYFASTSTCSRNERQPMMPSETTDLHTKSC